MLQSIINSPYSLMTCLQGASSDENISFNRGRAYVVGSVREGSGASKTYEQ